MTAFFDAIDESASASSVLAKGERDPGQCLTNRITYRGQRWDVRRPFRSPGMASFDCPFTVPSQTGLYL